MLDKHAARPYRRRPAGQMLQDATRHAGGTPAVRAAGVQGFARTGSSTLHRSM